MSLELSKSLEAAKMPYWVTCRKKLPERKLPNQLLTDIACLRLMWIILSAVAVEYTNCFQQRVSRYDTKQSDREVPVMLGFWGMRSTLSLPPLPDPLSPGVVVPDRVLSMGQIELNSVLMLIWSFWNRTVLTFKLLTYAKLICLKSNCFVS